MGMKALPFADWPKLPEQARLALSYLFFRRIGTGSEVLSIAAIMPIMFRSGGRRRVDPYNPHEVF
jgi:hypothetical protein